MLYLTLKYIHIFSMVILFGTGFGSAFYKWMADRSGNVAHIYITNRHVVFADWIFTTPTVIIQPLSGLYLASITGAELGTPWLLAAIVLYVIAGLCWLPVVWLQIKMRNQAQSSFEHNRQLPALYWIYARLWFYLGLVAFSAMVLVVYLMVFKPSLF